MAASGRASPSAHLPPSILQSEAVFLWLCSRAHALESWHLFACHALCCSLSPAKPAFECPHSLSLSLSLSLSTTRSIRGARAVSGALQLDLEYVAPANRAREGLITVKVARGAALKASQPYVKLFTTLVSKQRLCLCSFWILK
jgi:hypothetical protein